MPVRIYGAGMAGLLTATMLRRLRPIVMEAQAELPNNHGALLRFRTDAVARETGQPFRRVRVLKAVKRNGALHTTSTIRDANQYSQKVTGAITARSVLNLEACDRYIAPDNFCEMMARDTVLKFNAPLTHIAPREPDVTIISTIPMPALMRMVNWPTQPEFVWQPVWSVAVDVCAPAVDVHQTIYYPEPDAPYYRASITGARLIVEYMQAPTHWEDDVDHVLSDFGIYHLALKYDATIHPPKRQEYGKLLPLPDRARQEFILAMTDQYNLYSIGRFATWRQILLDDVVQDVRRVETWISQRTSYQRRLDLACT